MSDIEVKTTKETGPTPELRPFVPLDTLAPEPAHGGPLVPRAVAGILAVLASIGGFAAGQLQAPGSWMVAGLACLLALVAGVTGFEVPKFAVGRPLVSSSLIAPLATAAGFAVDRMATLPEGYERSLLGVAAIICVGLAGVPLPGRRGSR